MAPAKPACPSLRAQASPNSSPDRPSPSLGARRGSLQPWRWAASSLQWDGAMGRRSLGVARLGMVKRWPREEAVHPLLLAFPSMRISGIDGGSLMCSLAGRCSLCHCISIWWLEFVCGEEKTAPTDGEAQ